MARENPPVTVTLGSQRFVCTVCKSAWFRYKQVYVTAGASYFSQEVPRSLACLECGYLHMFFNPNLRTWTADQQ